MPAPDVFRSALQEAYPKLWRFCVARTGNPDAGSDLAQATALRALEKHAQFANGTRLDLWLYKMAHRVWLNELRSQKVRRGQGVVPIEEAGIPDLTADAFSNIFGRQVLSKVMALPEAQRVTVVLVYLEGFKYAEAAEMLDIPVGTVMSRLSAARKALQVDLADKKDASE